VEEPQPTDDPGTILGLVLAELEKAGHKMLASTLESGSVTLQGNELVVSIAQSAAVIDLMMSVEPRRLANAAASMALGRPAKVNVVSGVPAATNGATSVVRPRNGATARSRAAEDPIVQRMREKFGAEIRTVIDHREKN
jgi:DNA polymerase-3 subunit gamma/tau